MPPSRLVHCHAATLALLDGWLDLLADPARAERSRPAVSAWSVSQHADHVSRADATIVEHLERALAGGGGRRARGVSIFGRLVLFTGYIPRGVGKAPAMTRPAPHSEPAEVAARLATERRRIAGWAPRLGELVGLDPNLRHPYFGGLDAAQWLRFVQVHHRHHRKIVDAILGA